MNGDEPHGELQVVTMTAVEARRHLGELEAERAAAVAHDAIEVDAYRRDLEAEIEIWSRQFVIAAVTEMATLRAELEGPKVG
jgi:hypothetical protein